MTESIITVAAEHDLDGGYSKQQGAVGPSSATVAARDVVDDDDDEQEDDAESELDLQLS